jgi:hypothetical protein
MTNPLHKNRPAISLTSIILLAAVLRLWGITWGLPDETHLFSFHPDEYHSLRGALALATGDFNPHFFNYASLYLNIVAFVCNWHASIGGPDLLQALLKSPTAHVEMAAWVLDARIVTALFGIATVVIVWLAAFWLLGLRAATAAGLLMAIFPWSVLHSHYATVDVPQAFFITLCVLFSIRFFPKYDASGKQPHTLTLRDYALAGLAAGLAASVKYNGALVLLIPVLAHFIAVRQGVRTPHWPAALLMLPVTALFAFAATSPYVFLAWPEAWRDISYEMQHMRVGEEPIRSVYPNGWLFHFHPGLILLVPGLMQARSLRPQLLPVTVFTVIWWLMIGATGVRYGRYELPFEPVIALITGVAIAAMMTGPKSGRTYSKPVWVSIYLLLPCLVLGMLLNSSLKIMCLAEVNSVNQKALQILEQTVAPDEKIALIWEPWFDMPAVDYCNGGTTLRKNRIYSRFIQPIRELAIIGTNPDALEKSEAQLIIVSNYSFSAGFINVSLSHAKMKNYLQEKFSSNLFTPNRLKQNLATLLDCRGNTWISDNNYGMFSWQYHVKQNRTEGQNPSKDE